MIGNKIRERRIALKMTQSELGAKLDVGKSTISEWEHNKRVPAIEDLNSIAAALDMDPVVLGGWRSEGEVFEFDNIIPIETHRIPLLGNIACGEPVFADEDFESYVDAGADVKADFALRAKGDSMIGARIHDGDVVFIRRQPDVLDGEIAAVILDDEATLKRVYKTSGGRVLQAENPSYAPIYVGGPGETREIHILGKAIAFQSNVR